jgi:hypothetical protein
MGRQGIRGAGADRGGVGGARRREHGRQSVRVADLALDAHDLAGAAVVAVVVEDGGVDVDPDLGS